MKKFAVLSAAALIGLGSLAATQAEARDGRNGALAAGLIGGMAVGALVGSAANAYAAPAYGPVYVERPAPVYRTRRVVRSYAPVEEVEVEYAPRPRYRTTRVVRTYEYAPRYSYEAPAYEERW